MSETDGRREIQTWGISGQSETGHVDISKIETPTALSMFSGQRIASVSSTNFHTLLLTEEGAVWAWGHNSWGQCGSVAEMPFTGPVPVSFPQLAQGVKIVQAECGGYHSLALASDSTVFAWGRNTFGQLGIPSTGSNTFQHGPQIVQGLVGKNVCYVKAGRSFSLALTEDGDVYSWGLGMHGQLGHGNTSSTASPMLLEALRDISIVRVQCGNRHCCALAENGDVYFWGQSYDSREPRAIPTVVSGLCGKNIRHLECGGVHSLALSADGNVYSWGDGVCGQLGHGLGPGQTKLAQPKVIQDLVGRKVRFIKVGFYMSFALTEDGIMYAWGCSPRQVQNGVAEFGSREFLIEASATPKIVPMLSGRHIVRLSCGYNHYVAVVHDRSNLLPDLLPNTFTFTSDLVGTLNTPQYSDISFRVDGKTILAHRVVLASRCAYFQRMFSSGMQESARDCVVDITNFHYDTFYNFLLFLYGSHLPMETERLIPLLEISHSYGHPDLKTRCTQRLLNNLTVDNASSLYATADFYDVPILKQRCMAFIMEHYEQVIQTEGFAQLSRDCLVGLLRSASAQSLRFHKTIPMPSRNKRKRTDSE